MTIYINGRSQPDTAGGGVGEANIGANVGVGAGLVFRDKIGVALNFRSLLAGAGVSISTGANEVTINSAGTSQLMWGNDNIAATTTTRYLTPGYDDTQAQTSAIQLKASRDGTIRNMRVLQNIPHGNGNSIVYTLRVNGVASALSVSMASTDSDGSDLVNSVAVAAGDNLDIEVTKAAGIGTTPDDIVLTVEYA